MVEVPPLSFLKKQTVVIFGLLVCSGVCSMQNYKVMVKGDKRDCELKTKRHWCLVLKHFSNLFVIFNLQ